MFSLQCNALLIPFPAPPHFEDNIVWVFFCIHAELSTGFALTAISFCFLGLLVSDPLMPQGFVIQNIGKHNGKRGLSSR